MQKSYPNKVKLIYIDPPYNIDGDVVYKDNFQDNIKNYLELTGQVDGEGRKLFSNTEASGSLHTNWLNMIYPRLKLAKTLLHSDGVILVSLDDGEASNARKIMDEIFGEKQFAGIFPWRSRTAKADVPFGISSDVEWVICYAMGGFMAGREGARRYYKSDDYSDRWRLSDLTKQTTKDERPNSFFTMVNPKTGDKYPANPNRTWSITDDTFPDYYAKGKIVFPGDYDFLKNKIPAFRVFEAEDKAKALAKHGTDEVCMSVSTYLPEKTIGRTEHGSKEIRDLFESQVFSFPKPTSLIKFFLENFSNKDDLILDFFAGSGTTGHAVMAQNSTGSENRRYILVQLPESLDPENTKQKLAADYCDKLGKPRNIAELAKERLRRAARKIQEETPLFKGDLGFRVFKLDSTNIHEWEPNPANVGEAIQVSIEHLKADRSESDILYELLLKLGLDLAVPIEQKILAGKTVYCIGAGTLFACLATSISTKEVEPLAYGIIEWHKKLAPAGETQVVFRDNAFADDVAKTNLTAILEQHGLSNVRSI